MDSTTEAWRIDFWRRPRLPIMLQSETAECGLACLAMMSNYWGYRIDMFALRRRFALSLKGVTLASLIQMAAALKLQSRALKLDLDELERLQCPCILHWDLNHFVVLKKCRGDKVTIIDPAVGLRRQSRNEVSQHFTGVALELRPAADFTEAKIGRRFSIVSLMGRVVGLRRGLAQILVLGVCLQVCSLSLPFYLQWLVDDALPAADRPLIQVLGLGFLLLILLQVSLSMMRSLATARLATHLNFQWLGNAFTHLLTLPLPYFEKRHLGDVLSRFGSIQTIQKALTTQFVEGVIDGLLVATTLGVMLFYSWLMTALAASAVVLYCGLRLTLLPALRSATNEQILHAAKQQSTFIESVRGMQSLRLFGRTEVRRLIWANQLADQFNADLRIAGLNIVVQGANLTLFGVERILIIWLAALAILDGRFSIGMLLAYLSYKDQFTQRAAALVDKLVEWRMLHLQAERVADIVFSESEPSAALDSVEPERAPPTIEARGLGFRYADEERAVLHELSFTIAAGQCVAITGASGCGKTTLIKILLGLLEPTAGELWINGVALRQFGKFNLRSMTGAVMQDDQLFAGSIAENISFFDPSSQPQRVIEAARRAAIDAEISAMPMGYQSRIGDLGAGLSGGQKQRILLARALYARPSMLILDEATSHLDAANERLVNQAVAMLPMTRILVAHRRETVVMAERILTLHHGAIIADDLVTSSSAS